MEDTTSPQWLTGNGALTTPPPAGNLSGSRPQTDSPRTDAAPTAVPRILLVEDNADARNYLQRLLKPHYGVTAVADGQAALDAFYQQPPDLVLSDMAMPRLDGMQLLRILKEQHHTARVPVMLMSGETGEGIRIEAYQAGAVDYLLKPFSARELLVRVQAQLRLAPFQPGNERQLVSWFAQAPVGVGILGSGPDFTVELANPFFCQIAGRTADQLVGKPLLEALPEMAEQGFEKLLVQVVATGEPYVSRETVVALVRNGQPGIMYADFVYQPRYEVDQTITGVVVMVTDITRAVQARQRVEVSERLLDAMFRQTRLGVGILRGPELIIELMNPTLYQLWGGSHKQVIEKPLLAALPGATVAGQAFEKMLANVYETGIRFELNEIPVTAKRNGRSETSYFNFSYEPLRNQDGAIERIMVVATDVTKVREARRTVVESEQRYRQLAAELEERVKQRTHDLERSNLDLMQFASVASHDLKEPLRKVQIFGTRLEGMLAGRLNEEEADLFRRLVSATGRMQTLVGDVLRLSMLSEQAVGFEPVVLNATMDRIRDDLELVIHERGAELTTESLPTVLAAQGQMHQLFQNLISNALKFNNNPVPTVRVEPVPLTDNVAQELGLPTRDYAVIAVTDNGIGFESKYKDKIFGMFQRLHGRSQYAGTGIGLTIVRKIIENHRGFIDVHSEPGRGTVFRVALPFR